MSFSDKEGLEQDIFILPSEMETIDFSVFDKINDSFDLHANTNEGFKKCLLSGLQPKELFK